jgi:catalase
MSTDLKSPVEAESARVGKWSALPRFALIGVVLAALAAAFAYVGGWFTPGKLTPARFADGFEDVNGVHPGFRRNHAKGVGVSGYFESNGDGARVSKAAVFRQGRVPVIGRFSLGGGQPHQPDEPGTVRGLGLQFSPEDSEEWRTAMINLPVFPFRTPEAFYEQMLASKLDPATGKPDQAKLDEFIARHPETAKALEHLKTRSVPSGFGNSTFYALHVFRFTNAEGATTPVRWLLKPEQAFEAAKASPDKNYLFDDLIAQIHRQPLRWHLIVILGQAGDPTDDATLPWPEDRETVDVGTVTLDKVESDDTSPAASLNFDPLVLPAGMAPSDDPLLSARSAVYSQSYTRRAGEAKHPAAITPDEVRKGD